MLTDSSRMPGASGRPLRFGIQRMLVLMLTLSLVVSAMAWTPAVTLAATFTTSTNVNLRNAPDPAAETLLVIPGGTTVEVTGEAENGFLPVAHEGIDGFVAAEFLTAGDTASEPETTSEPATAPGPTGTWYVTGGSLNLRAGPGATYDVLAELPDGTGLDLTGTISGEFSEVFWNDTTGWVATLYLTPEPPVAPAPPTEEAAPTEEVAPTDEPESTTATAPVTEVVTPEPDTGVGGEGDEDAAPGMQSFALQDEPIGTAVVTTSGLNLNMRSGPGTSHGVVRSIPSGATVEVMGAAESGFLPVRYQGTTGWASTDWLNTSANPTPTQTATATPATPTPTSTVPGGGTPIGSAVVTTVGLNLNMRSGPATSYGVVRSIPSGATVDVMGAAQSGFLPVRYQGSSGWASADFLRVGGATTPTATPETPTPTASPVTPTPTATPETPTPTATATGTPGTDPIGTALVITDGLNLNMRSGPGTTYGVVRSIPPGATVDVMGAGQNGFLPVRYQGNSGWASADWLSTSANPTPTATATPETPTPTATATPETPTPTSTPETPTATATPITPTATPTQTPTVTPTSTPGDPSGTATVNAGGSRLNMRSGPGTQYPVVQSMPDGAVVEVTGEAQNGFLPVRYLGINGWSSADFLVPGGTPTTPTVTPTPTNPPGVPDIPDAAIGKATINTTVSLRRGPDSSYGHIQTLNNGWKVEIMGEAVNGWTPIRYNAAKGWVPSANLTDGWGWTIVDQMITPVRSIPMMSGPNSGTRVVQVPPGTLVDITGAAQGTWAPARWSGNSGWMDTSLMYHPEDFVEPGPQNPHEAQMIEIIYDAADRWGQSRVDMLRVARCESHLNPTLVNPNGGASGLFQFMPSTFAFTPNGKAGADIFDPWQSADAAGWMWANGMRHHWACQ